MTDLSVQSLSNSPSALSLWSVLAGVFGAWAAARAAASALEMGHRPDAADLRELGIDPVAFAKIRLH